MEHTKDQHLSQCSFCESLINPIQAEVHPVETLESELQSEYDEVFKESEQEEEIMQEEEVELEVEIDQSNDDEVDEDTSVPLDSITVEEDDEMEEKQDSDYSPVESTTKRLRRRNVTADYDCDHCDKSYTRQWKLLEHLFQVHNVSDVPKDMEKKEPPVVILITDGDPFKNSVHPFACHLCQKSYSRKEKLKLHLQKIHKCFKVPRMTMVAEFTCSKCPKTFKCQQTFDKHQQEHDPFPFKCIVCADSFSTRREWRYHEGQCLAVTALGNGQHKCPYCQSLFASVDQFKIHMKDKINCNVKTKAGDDNESDISENKILSCDICMATFDDDLKLQVHKELRHAECFECVPCNKTFETRVLLKKHTDRIHKSQTYQCTTCGQVLSRADKLTEHMRIHTGYPCSSCNILFKTRKEFRLHSNAHCSK